MDVEAEQKRPRAATPSTSPASLSQCFEHEGTLQELLNQIRDPPTLVRASLVCKNLYRIASNDEFLRQFCEDQPPRLLGYFAVMEEGDEAFFMLKKVPEPAGDSSFFSASFLDPVGHALDRRSGVLEKLPEFASVGRFLSYRFDGLCEAPVDCYKDHLLIKFEESLGIYNPLRQPQHLRVLPPIPRLPYLLGDRVGEYFLLTDELSAVYLRATWLEDGALGIDISCLLGNEWEQQSNSVHFDQESQHNDVFCYPALLVDNHVYMLTIEGFLVGVSLVDREIFKVDLPTVEWHQWGSHQLCRAQGAGFFYVNTKGYDLQIWLYGEDGWSHFSTINLPFVFATSNLPWDAVNWDESRAGWGEVVTIYGIGDAAKFIFLGVSGDEGLFLLDVGHLAVEKIGYKSSEEKGDLIGNRIIPLVSSCTPFFPLIVASG